MAEFCQECSRLLADYVNAVRQVRIALGAAVLAAEAGVIDDTGFILADGEVEGRLSTLRHAQQHTSHTARSSTGRLRAVKPE